MDRSMKQVDLASIASLLTKLPVPFSNLGIMHPAFAQTSDMDEIITLMRENLEQVNMYLHRYCEEDTPEWCET